MSVIKYSTGQILDPYEFKIHPFHSDVDFGINDLNNDEWKECGKVGTLRKYFAPKIAQPCTWYHFLRRRDWVEGIQLLDFGSTASLNMIHVIFWVCCNELLYHKKALISDRGQVLCPWGPIDLPNFVYGNIGFFIVAEKPVRFCVLGGVMKDRDVCDVWSDWYRIKDGFFIPSMYDKNDFYSSTQSVGV